MCQDLLRQLTVHWNIRYTLTVQDQQHRQLDGLHYSIYPALAWTDPK